MIARPCLDCGRLVTGMTRCPPCNAEAQRRRDVRRGSPSARGYDWAWQQRSRAARQEQGWCDNCGATSDLTADHVVPLARGGTNDMGNVRVLCRACNGAKGSRYA